MTDTPPLLEVRDLEVCFDTDDGPVMAVDGLDFSLGAGETLGIVGESGSGKSQTALAVLGLLAANARVRGSVLFEGRDLLRATEADRRRVRGARIGMVFQDPMTSLNPYLRIGVQMAEVLELHRGMRRSAALAEAARMLDAVQLPDSVRRLQAYPHELSGGQRQRVMMAMTLLPRPALLLADEPTTALDVTVQAGLLRLLTDLQAELGLAIVFITHDMGVVAEVCRRTLVMYGGRCMEQGPTADLLAAPRHPYTAGLLAARPRLDGDRGQPLVTLPGQPPLPAASRPGCPFAPRCPEVEAICHGQRPRLTADRRPVACHQRGSLSVSSAGV